MACLLSCTTVRSQQFPNLQLDYLSIKEGLSNNNVSYITQDQQGFIWIGTNDGLNRFDGYRIRSFYHNPSDRNSLINNTVSEVLSDHNNRLWISTQEGFSVYNKRSGVFTNFRHNPSDTTSIDNDQFNSIFINQNNSAWVTTPTSLYYFDSTLRFRKVSDDKTIKSFEKDNKGSYNQLMRDKTGNWWGFSTNFIYRLDSVTMRPVEKFGPVPGNIRSIYQDSNLQFWIASFGGGLLSFNPQNGKIVPIQLAGLVNVVFSISEWPDSRHKIWLVLASDQGLILVDPVSYQSKIYTFHRGYFPLHLLSKNEVHYVFVDRQNILWIATEAGVGYVRPSRQLFELWDISSSSELLPTAVSDWIYSICETSKGFWMARWVGPGIYFFSKEGKPVKSIQRIFVDHKVDSLSGSLKPYYIGHSGDTVLWITTNEYLIHYDIHSDRAELFKPADGDDITGLRTITVIDDHHWWIRTRNNGPNGIYIFDPVIKKFTYHFKNSPDCDDCVPPKLLTLFYSSKKEIYATAVGRGLFKYDSATGRFVSVFKFQGQDLQQHSNSFECIEEDSKGILWIGTYSGLFAWDPVTKKIVKDYTENELVGGVEVLGIIIDPQQNLWICSGRGVFYLMHRTGQLKQLGETRELASNAIGTFHQANDHSLLLSIQGYVLRMKPDELLYQAEPNAPVHFSDATIMDTPEFFHYNSSGEKILTIQPGQNRFSLDFSVLNYDQGNNYYYKLQGLMSDWQQNENGHLVFYNLSPGTYTLLVKGGIKYSSLPVNEDKVKIIVQPYWWQTNWFKFGVFLFLVVLITYLVRRRIAFIRREAFFKQRIVETEMTALRLQMNPHFIFNSLNSIENFMMQNEKRQAISYLNKFSRLIRIILDSSRSELIPLSKDLEALRLYTDLEQLRFRNKFRFQFDVQPDLLNSDYSVPPLLIQPYVENAIVHGLAHSERQDLLLSVSVLMKGDSICYRIRDNGVGRELAAVYNQQNRPHHKSLGLSITEERIRIFNRNQNTNGQLTITDLYDAFHQPAGTEVEIKIKAV